MILISLPGCLMGTRSANLVDLWGGGSIHIYSIYIYIYYIYISVCCRCISHPGGGVESAGESIQFAARLNDLAESPTYWTSERTAMAVPVVMRLLPWKSNELAVDTDAEGPNLHHLLQTAYDSRIRKVLGLRAVGFQVRFLTLRAWVCFALAGVFSSLGTRTAKPEPSANALVPTRTSHSP